MAFVEVKPVPYVPFPIIYCCNGYDIYGLICDKQEILKILRVSACLKKLGRKLIPFMT